MPVYTGSALQGISYDDLISWVNISTGNSSNLDAYLAEAAKYSVDEMTAVEDFASTYMNFYKNGDGSYTITSFNNTAQVNNVNPVDSNLSTISRGNVQTPLNRGIDSVTGKLNITKYPASGSFGQRASYVLGSVGSAVAAVSTGITLGKAIDGALYNVNPDYWDSIGLSSLNPETWSTITNGDDSWQAGLFNFILGINPDTGETQAYMDENALAYMAYALAQNGWFTSGATVEPTQAMYVVGDTVPASAFKYGTLKELCDLLGFPIDWNRYYPNQEKNLPAVIGATNIGGGVLDFIVLYGSNVVPSSDVFTISRVTSTGYYTNETIAVAGTYYKRTTVSNGSSFGNTTFNYFSTELINQIQPIAVSIIEPPIGITDQDNANLPDTSTWNDIPSTLQSLQQQYPDLFDDALVYDNYQPDGTNPQIRYIPVTLPQTTNPTDTQPTSGNQTQTTPIVSPDTSLETLLNLMTNIATEPNPQTQTQTQTQTPSVPQNPISTGTGTTPTIPTATGAASALWSVYHPTQAQLNSFGSWLWTGNIITQIQQVLQNPMDGIITLHKVFATPVDSGSGTIVVGRLDSQVPSATVSEQYVYVDCGSVNCLEAFGNVFDYAPHTHISLYLPFIGIVPLNTDEVMRGTINVTYGVDVFTGACLAMVEVTRDGNVINLYQYSGVASVEYPLTGNVHSGLISGILGVASGVAGIAMASTGVGAVSGALVASGGVANAMKSTNAHASSFSGNAGAMGIKTPYLIIERPQTKVADTFSLLNGYPTNVSGVLSEFSGHVVVKHVHVEGINATDNELTQIESLLKEGILI